MRLFNKKDKRYNDYFDNYSNKYLGTLKLGLVYLVVGVVIYCIYKFLIMIEII
jgi:hypothetical protein